MSEEHTPVAPGGDEPTGAESTPAASPAAPTPAPGGRSQSSSRGGNGQGPRPRSRRGNKQREDRNRCRFCRATVTHIDYKDVITLQKLVTSQGKMFSRRRSGNCSRHQRLAKLAIKKARFMALMPYLGG
jgi:small subunit ribosomal protein S18